MIKIKRSPSIHWKGLATRLGVQNWDDYLLRRGPRLTPPLPDVVQLPSDIVFAAFLPPVIPCMIEVAQRGRYEALAIVLSLKTLADVLNESEWVAWLPESERYRFAQTLEMMCFGLGIAVSESTEDAVWVWGRKRGEMPRYAVKGERVS